MPNKIQDIICDFKNKFGLSGLWSKPTSYMEYEDVTNKVEDYLQSSLTSLLDSIEKEATAKKADIEFMKKNFPVQDTINKLESYNNGLEEVINIINSHR